MSVLDRSDHRGRRSVIVAADVWTALGRDLDETWSALLAGRTAVAPVTGFDASGFGDPHAAQVWAEAAESEDDPVLRILGRHGQLVDVVLKRLHEAAGLAVAPRDRVGLYVCTGQSDTPIGDLAPAVKLSRDGDGAFDRKKFFAGAFRRLHPLWPLAILQNVAVGQISIDLDIRGDNVVLSSEGDASVRSITEAAHAVADAAADHVLVGGASTAVSAAHLARLGLRGDLGQGPATPGSITGDGCSPGEAAGAILLEREGTLGEHRPLADLRGGATVFHRAEGRTGPTEDAFRRAIEGALGASGVEGRDLDAVFLHAEGSAGQDAAEIRAVAELEGTSGNGPRLVATKGALGNTGGGAPVVDVALAVRAIETGILPPTVTRGAVQEEFRGRLHDKPVEGELRRILVITAGSLGGAGALVVEAVS